MQQIKKNVAQKKVKRILEKNPTLLDSDTTYIIKNDTINVIVSEYKHDTIFDSRLDSIIIETERFKTIIKRMPYDSIQYRIKTLIKSDTIQFERIDSVIVINEKIVTKTEYINSTPWWFIILSMIILIGYFWAVNRYNKSL